MVESVGLPEIAILRSVLSRRHKSINPKFAKQMGLDGITTENF